MRKLSKAAALALALVIGATAACGSGGDTSKSAAGGAGDDSVVAQAQLVEAVSAKVPDNIKSAGILSIATDPNYPPFEYYDTDNKTVIGLDVDMGRALGRVMGIDVQFNPVAFDGIIPGIAADKYQAAMSFLGDIKERQRTVDFVDYIKDTTSLMVKKGNPLGLSLDNLCGRAIAVQKGSTQDVKITPELSMACANTGKPAIDKRSYPSQDQANLAVTSGRVDGSLLVTSVVGRVVGGSNGALEQAAGEGIYPKKYGIIVPKGSPLGPVLQAALVELRKQGVYTSILEKWGQAASAINDFTINDPDAE